MDNYFMVTVEVKTLVVLKVKGSSEEQVRESIEHQVYDKKFTPDGFGVQAYWEITKEQYSEDND